MSKIKEIIDKLIKNNDVEPSFLEKDVYITRILETLSNIKDNKITPVFSGGTSLHKGHQIIKRFSEDVDFRVKTETNISRNERRDFRNLIIEEINKIPDLKVIEETIISKNQSRFFGFYVNYPKKYNLDKSLRSNIKFEIDFEKLLLNTTKCEIDGIINVIMKKNSKTYDDKENKSFEMDCISLEEIAGNKLSALMWRTQIKDRSQPFGIKNDPTIIRHLHDLSAMSDKIKTDNFIFVLKESFKNDLGRSGSNRDINLIESLNNTFNLLKNDKIYKKEYDTFVANMCYGTDEETIEFKTALNDFKEIKDFALDVINSKEHGINNTKVIENEISNKNIDFDLYM